MVDKIYENNINFNQVKVTTNWKNGYTIDDFTNSIKTKSKYNRTYDVILNNVDNIDTSKFDVQKVMSKTFTKRDVVVINTEELSKKEFYPNLVMPNKTFNIELYGYKEVIDSIDITKLNLYVDFNDFSWISTKKDDTGVRSAHLYLDTNGDVYYKITPSNIDLSIVYRPLIHMSEITNEQIKEILNKFSVSEVRLYMDKDIEVSCAKNKNGEVECQFFAEDNITDNLFKAYERFGFGHNSNGFPTGTGGGSGNYELSTCLDQLRFYIK